MFNFSRNSNKITNVDVFDFACYLGEAKWIKLRWLDAWFVKKELGQRLSLPKIIFI